ncbi:unnamed protein product [Rotaria sp. Silwood2]|nr:unnamed protein product [Rotaria sp. Silwood2]
MWKILRPYVGVWRFTGLQLSQGNNFNVQIQEYIIRRLEWTRLQTLVILKSNSTSITFYVDSSIDELHIDISSTG